MNEMILSFENLKDRYPVDKYIHLLPTVSKHIVGQRAMYSLDVSTVKIDPNDPNMIYSVRDERRGKDWVPVEVGLTKVALNMICGLADVDVVCDRMDDMRNKEYACFRARAAMQTASGSVRGRTSSVEWDADIMKARIWQRCKKWVQKKVQYEDRGYKGLTQAQMVTKAEERFEDQWLDERQYGKRKVESMACRNAISNLLAMAGTYAPEELAAKEFAVAKLVFTPDLEDPVIRQMFVQQGMQAQQALYGVTAAQAAGGLLSPGVGRVEDIEPEPVQQEEPAQTWEEVSKEITFIATTLAAWDGPNDSKLKYLDDYTKAVAQQDVKLMERLINICRDIEIVAEQASDEEAK